MPPHHLQHERPLVAVGTEQSERSVSSLWGLSCRAGLTGQQNQPPSSHRGQATLQQPRFPSGVPGDTGPQSSRTDHSSYSHGGHVSEQNVALGS